MTAYGCPARDAGVALCYTVAMLRSYGNISPVLGSRVYVDEAARVIGRVRAGDDVSFWPMVVARGDVNEIVIGQRTNIQDGSILHVTHDGPYSPGGIALLIGDEVTVGHKAVLHACTVGARCLIGMGAIVMDGAVIEDDVIVAAGSLVTPGKRLQSRHLYQGSPARKVRALRDSEIEMLAYSAAHYVRLKDQYLSS